jgi:hypothetical protein
MKRIDLVEIIEVECENLEKIISEINRVNDSIKDNEPNLMEKTALAHYLMSVYNGFENLMKNLCKFHGVLLPNGEFFHVELFKLFCFPQTSELPVLISENIKSGMQELRKFRHIARQGYAFNFEWSRMKEGVNTIDSIYKIFKDNLNKHLEVPDNSDK